MFSGIVNTCKTGCENTFKKENSGAKLLSIEKAETLFLQQFESEWFPGEKQRSADPSIPHEANSPENDTFDADNSPPQKCVAMVKCMPESRISKANDMDKSFFIYTFIRSMQNK